MPVELYREKSSWFQKVLTRLNELKLERRGALADNDSTSHINNLPAELLEAILSHIDDNATLFICRLVNWKWNHEAMEVLEIRHLRHWTNMEAKSEYTIPPSAPLLLEKRKRFRKQGFKLPSVLKSHKKSRNPFPTKSILISHCRYPSIWNIHKEVDKPLPKWDKFVMNFGNCLTSLILYRVDMTADRLNLLLTHTSCLKALTLHHVEIDKTVLLEKIACPILPHLLYLKVACNDADVFSNWILDNCAHQLVTFTLSYWRSFTVGLRKRKFKRLKKLEIYSTGQQELTNFWESEMPPNLESISFGMSYKFNVVTDQDYLTVLNFIGQFSSSLVRLCVNIELPVMLRLLKGSGIIFPKLCSLLLKDSQLEENWQDAFIIQNGLNVFPNVKSVKFFH